MRPESGNQGLRTSSLSLSLSKFLLLYFYSPSEKQIMGVNEFYHNNHIMISRHKINFLC